ncbi:MAG: type II toxin-antitoxin system RelE/ParE family toxin [Lachnospiraceae bacterium]|nr:type II toxin-antitoxin system RelE/ParE family toxin [Lachnospiraceae bacterium]
MHNIIFYEKENGQSEIWELRPGNNRIFYFFCDNNSFVLLHSFRKKTQKTPRREISKAKSERDDYLSRKENFKL